MPPTTAPREVRGERGRRRCRRAEALGEHEVCQEDRREGERDRGCEPRHRGEGQQCFPGHGPRGGKRDRRPRRQVGLGVDAQEPITMPRKLARSTKFVR
jgi:hypothetical protein